MSNRRKSSSFSDIDLYSGGYSPFEAAGQRALSREQEAFDYGQLDQKYPVRGVRPVVPSYIQKQLDEEEVIRKSQELEMRRREAQLNIYDSQINQERAMYEQIPMARQALAELNPADDDFLNQLITQQANNPLAYENPDFQQTVVNPLIRRHEMLQQNKMIIQRGQKPEETREITEEAFQKAAGLLSDPTFQKQVQAGDQIALGRAAVARETYNQFMRQRGLAGETQPQAPMGMPEIGVAAPPAQGTVGQRPSLDDIFR